MFKSWSMTKPWVRWTIGSLAAIVLLCLMGTGFLYYRIHSINLVDIQERQKQKELGKQLQEPTSVPSALSGSIDKANQFASKPIESQDALDVAAILLQSGLSLKEVYFLTGKTTDKLSTEEKEKIRNLLLAKLTKAEIEALRAITSQYGKGLLILDPNYPIELVGVYDEAERARITKELEERQKTASLPKPTSAPTILPEVTPGATIDKVALNSPAPVVPSATPTAQMEQIRANYKSQLNALQSGCESNANAMIAEITSAIIQSQSKNEPISFETLQTTYLSKTIQEEQRCDQQFNSIVDVAKKQYQEIGMSIDELDVWKSQYSNAKDQARMKAMSQLKFSSK